MNNKLSKEETKEQFSLYLNLRCLVGRIEELTTRQSHELVSIEEIVASNNPLGIEPTESEIAKILKIGLINKIIDFKKVDGSFRYKLNPKKTEEFISNYNKVIGLE